MGWLAAAYTAASGCRETFGGSGTQCSSQRSRCIGPWGLPGAPLLTGLPPRSSRHWRRSAPTVRKGRAASARGAFLALPCALGFRLASSATGGARLPQFAKAVSWRRKRGLLQRRKATQKPGPTIYGPGYIIHLQEGTRHRPHTSGKAAAHALRAAAEQTPCRGLLTGGDLRPHVREYRRPRRTA